MEKNAIKHAEKALDYCLEGGVHSLLPLANGILGSAYLLLDESRSASKYFLKALQLQKDLGMQMYTSSFYLGLGRIDLESGTPESAQSCVEKGLDFAQKNSERNSEGNACIFLGRILGKKERAQFDKAEENIMKGIKILENTKTKPFISQGYLYLGDLYNDMGRKEEALKYL